MSSTGKEKSPIFAPPEVTPSSTTARDVVRLPLLALLFVPALAAPEVHGDAMVGGALLVILAFLSTPLLGSGRRGAGAVVAVSAAGLALGCAAASPGAVWGPWAAAVLATALAVAASVSGQSARSSYAVQAAIALAGAGSWVGGRAIWERWAGLEILAARVRALEGIASREAILDRLEQGRAYAGFVTPAAAGIFLVMAILATVSLARVSTGRSRLAAAAAVGVQLLGLVATRSLTAAGVLVVVGVFGLTARGGTARRFGLVAVSVAAGVLLAGIVWRGPAVLSWEQPDSPWRERAGNVRIALEITRAAPWIGVGPGGYGEVFPAFRRTGDNESRHAHCLPAELAAELGIVPGVLAAAAFFAFFGRRAIPVLRSGDTVRAGLLLAGIAFALHNLVDFTAWLPSVLWPALIAAGAARHMRPSGSRPQPATMFGVALFFVSLAAVLAARGGLAEDARKDGLDAFAEGDAAQGRVFLHRAVSLAPWSPDVAVAAAAAAVDDAIQDVEDAKGKDQARVACERAVRQAPRRASARALRARARALLGDIPGAYADLRRAAELDPLRDSYRIDAAALRIRLPRVRP